MKTKKISRILGVVLTLVMVLTLAVALAPVASADPGANKWTKFGTPAQGSDGKYIMWDDIVYLGPMARAIDGTIYITVYDGTNYLLFSSTDDGRTWGKKSNYPSGSDQVNDIACSSLDAEVVYVTDGNDIFKTEDAGSTWNTISNLSDNITGVAEIMSLDVGYIDEKPFIFAGCADGLGGGGAYTCEEAVYGQPWGDLDIMTDRVTDYTSVDVWDLRVSPDFEDDQMVMAVVTRDGTDTVATTKYAGQQWASYLGDATLLAGNTTAIADTYRAQIWLPGDFDSDKNSGQMEYFVGIATLTSDAGDVYWMVTNNAFDRGANINVTGLDGAGNVGDTMLVAAGNDDATPTALTVRWSDDNSSTWTTTKKAPTGSSLLAPIDQAMASVLVFPDYADSETALVASTGNTTAGDGFAAVSRTTDGSVTWNQISLIDTAIGTILDIEPTPDWGSSGALFMVTNVTDMTGSPPYAYMEGDSLWKHDGDVWERVFHDSLLNAAEDSIDDVEVSPEWTDDTTAFFIDWDNDRAYRATDSGNRFIRCLNASPDSVTGWLVVDKSTIVVGGNGFTRKTTNNCTTWGGQKTAGDDDITNFALDPNNPDNILCANDSDNVYLSEDGAGKWTIQPASGSEVDSGMYSFVAFDSDFANNSLIYAASLFGEVYRAEVGTSTSWAVISDLDGTWVEADGGPASVSTEAMWNMQMGSNGILYVTDWDSPVARCINPTASKTADVLYAPYFETISGSWESGDYPYGLWLVAGSSNTLWTINWDDAKIWEYTDEIDAGPTLSSPSNKSSSLRVDEVTLGWNAVTNATAYRIHVATNEDFVGYDPYESTTTGRRVQNLEDGKTYYWRVAVKEGKKALSRFSDTFSFTTALAEAQWNPFVGGIPEAPVNGATGVPIRPTFAWNPADWATGYEFVLADNPAYNPIVSKTLDTTVYECEVDLEYSTTYYWRVRAVSASSQSEWASAVFTTMGKAAPPPTAPPPVTVTPAPQVVQQAIPDWMLITIIAIGAVLVITVIVLIVRTRRAV
jgi:hypothetical protein